MEFDPCRPVSHAHRGDAEAVGFFGGIYESLDIGWVDRDRFFDQHMLPGLECVDREIDMGFGVRADGDEMDVWMVDDVGRVLGELRVREVEV